MSKRSSIVHVEWRSRNVSRLKEFYKSAFRWKFDESMPGYLLANAGRGEFGVGFAQIDGGSSLNPGVVAFLEAEDLGASETAIREAGGQILGTPQDVPGWGRFSLFTDPDGNPMGLWQSATKVKKEEKRHKKAEKRRQKAAAQASQPETTSDGATRKADKRKEKLEKRAQKLAAKAEKKAKKSAKKAEAAERIEKKAKKAKKAAPKQSQQASDGANEDAVR